jgi:hypothetical protein
MHQVVLQRRATVPFPVAAAPQHTVMQYSTTALVQARHAAFLAAALPDLSVATFDHQGADLLGGPAKRIRSPSSSKPAPVGLAWHPGMPLLVTAWADQSLTFSVFYLDGSLHYQKILPPPKRQQVSACWNGSATVSSWLQTIAVRLTSLTSTSAATLMLIGSLYGCARDCIILCTLVLFSCCIDMVTQQRCKQHPAGSLLLHIPDCLMLPA